MPLERAYEQMRIRVKGKCYEKDFLRYLSLILVKKNGVRRRKTVN